MEKTDKEFQELKKSIRELIKLDFITPDEIPGMELYMDQLTRYMDKHLGSTLRDESDKALTKTMINNYTKNNQRHKKNPRTDDGKRLRGG